LWSLRFAPSTVRPSGMPAASVTRLRLVPSLARSVGLGPVFFPTQRGLGHGPVHGQPTPVQPLERIVGEQSASPELVEHSVLRPLEESAVSRRTRADTGTVQGVPGASGAQHEHDRVHGIAVWYPRSMAAQRMWRGRGKQWLHLHPQLVGNSPAVILGNKTHANGNRPVWLPRPVSRTFHPAAYSGSGQAVPGDMALVLGKPPSAT
jgi:hypothetical protein